MHLLRKSIEAGKDGGEGFITRLLAIFFCVNKQKSVFGGSADIRKSRTRLPLGQDSSGSDAGATKVLRILCTQMGRRCAPPPSLEEAGAALWDSAHSESAYTSRARSSCAAVLDFGHLVGGEIQEQAGGWTGRNEP